MTLHCLYEGMCQSHEQWQDILTLARDDIDTLVKDRVFSPYTTNSGQRVLRLDLVGLIALSNRAFFCMPKIHTDLPCDRSDYGVTLQVIRKYIAQYRRSFGTALHNEASSIIDKGSYLDLFFTISELTVRNGFHNETQHNFTEEPSTIDWQRTMRLSLAIHQQGNVVYASPHYIDGQHALTDLGRVQALCLLDLHDRLFETLSLLQLQNSEIIEVARGLRDQFDDWSDHDISSALRRADECLFRDDERDLVRSLKLWYQNRKVRGNIVALVGINAFHTVWESMCIHLLSGSGQAIKHEDIALQPRYEIDGIEIPLTAQRPDILIDTRDGILLADAKWYHADVRLLPGTPDAIKQIAYETSITAQKPVISNSFLLPTISNIDCRPLGRLTCGPHQGVEHNVISLFLIGWRFAAENYIGKARSQMDWVATLKRPRP